MSNFEFARCAGLETTQKRQIRDKILIFSEMKKLPCLPKKISGLKCCILHCQETISIWFYSVLVYQAGLLGH